MTNPKHQITATWPGKGLDLVYKDATGEELIRSRRYYLFAVVGPSKPVFFRMDAAAAYRDLPPKAHVVGIGGTVMQSLHLTASAVASAACTTARDFSDWAARFEAEMNRLVDAYDAKCRAESGLPARKEN